MGSRPDGWPGGISFRSSADASFKEKSLTDLGSIDSSGGPLPFEEALRELEEVVELLESGNVPLEQSIALARRGLSLAEYCDRVVSQAEATLEQLVATADGELVTQRLAYDDDDEEDATASEHE